TPTTATKLNFGAITDLPFTFSSGLTAAVSLHLSGAVALSAAGVAAATTDQFSVDHLTVSEGDAWAFSLTSPHAFVGVGAGLDATPATASGYTVHDGTVGVAADASSFELASITQGATTNNGLQVTGLNG